jgi:tRNA-binding protein
LDLLIEFHAKVHPDRSDDNAPPRAGITVDNRAPLANAVTMDNATITYADFEQIDIRVGIIVDAKPFPEARKPAIKLWIDFGGDLGIKQSSAQITVHYKPDRLLGRQVCAVVNFPPRQIGPFISEVLTLGMPDAEGAVVLVRPDFEVPIGGKLF